MAVPKFFKICRPLLEASRDGRPHTQKELRSKIAESLGLSQDDLKEKIPSGRQTTFVNRLSWAKTYLCKAGLLDAPKHGEFVITRAGSDALRDGPSVFDPHWLEEKISSYIDSKRDSGDPTTTDGDAGQTISDEDETTAVEGETPDEMLDRSFKTIDDSLADEVLKEVMRLTPTAFEQFVVDLLLKMGYGGAFEGAGKTTQATRDGGIDGVIMEDKLGFDLIYVQAKQWAPEKKSVGKDEINQFSSVVRRKGGKGLFVTTAQYTKDAEDAARADHIILIDGKRLARLMIEHDFCVSVKRTFAIKAIDTDAFADYDHKD